MTDSIFQTLNAIASEPASNVDDLHIIARDAKLTAPHRRALREAADELQNVSRAYCLLVQQNMELNDLLQCTRDRLATSLAHSGYAERLPPLLLTTGFVDLGGTTFLCGNKP